MDKEKTKSREPLCGQIPLQPQKIAKKSIAGIAQVVSGMASMAFFYIVFFPSLALRGGIFGLLGTALVLFGALCLGICAYEFVYFRRYFYDMRGGVLTIRKGVFTYGETTVPLSRIQDVIVERDLLDKIFGLYNVRVSTATLQSGVHAHIDGLSEEGAEKLKGMLLPAMLSFGKRRK